MLGTAGMKRDIKKHTLLRATKDKPEWRAIIADGLIENGTQDIWTEKKKDEENEILKEMIG